MKYTEAEMCLIWLDSFIGLEYRHKEQIYKLVSDQPEIRRTLERAREYFVTEIGEKEFNVVLNSANGNYFSSVMEGLDKRGIRAVTIVSDDYPENLKNIPIPPLVLYCKGDVSLLNGEKFAGIPRRCGKLRGKFNECRFYDSVRNSGRDRFYGVKQNYFFKRQSDNDSRRRIRSRLSQKQSGAFRYHIRKRIVYKRTTAGNRASTVYVSGAEQAYRRVVAGRARRKRRVEERNHVYR